MKIISIVGIRSQFIKAALLKDKKRLRKMSRQARKVGERFDRRRLAEDYFYNVILPAWKEHNL